MPNLPDDVRIDDQRAPWNQWPPRIKERLIDINGIDTWFYFVESEGGMEVYIKDDNVNYSDFFKTVFGRSAYEALFDDLFGPKTLGKRESA